MKSLAVIPARYASTRLPGKPLAILGGKPLVEHVFIQVRNAGFDRVIIATDDLRIAEAVEKFGGEAMMTSPDAASGTDRIVEAVSVLEEAGQQYDVIVNVQGDEPFIETSALDECLDILEENPEIGVVTLAERIMNPQELIDPNVVKVVDDFNDHALYFSRSLIPFPRDYVGDDGRLDLEGAFQSTVYLKHIGVYAYRKSALMMFVSQPPSPLEMIEKLEQLRFLQAGGKIRILEVEGDYISVDTPEDLARAEERMAKSS